MKSDTSNSGMSSETKIIIAIVCSVFVVVAVIVVVVVFILKKAIIVENDIQEMNSIETRFEILSGITKLKQIGSGIQCSLLTLKKDSLGKFFVEN